MSLVVAMVKLRGAKYLVGIWNGVIVECQSVLVLPFHNLLLKQLVVSLAVLSGDHGIVPWETSFCIISSDGHECIIS